MIKNIILIPLFLNLQSKLILYLAEKNFTNSDLEYI